MYACSICKARYRTGSQCPLDGGRLDELQDPLIGRMLSGRYVVLERIGAGGMSTVYRARHELVGRDVALKFLLPELARRSQYRERFLREARAANRIHHENIISITDFGATDDGLVYLAMEYLVGEPLSKLISSGPIAIDRALDITVQVARALARAHELGVIHRDIKPDNLHILPVDGRDQVKVLDFGLAHMKGELRLTATGAVFGTPEYIAPEQARGAPVGPAADLYSLGCVLYEMLTSHPPFEGSTPEVLVKHLRQAPLAPSMLRPEVARPIDDLVLRLLAKEPEARPHSAFELMDAIKAIRGGGTFRPPAAQISRTPPANARPGTSEDGLARTAPPEDAWGRRIDLFREFLARLSRSYGPQPEIESGLSRVQTHLERVKYLRERLNEAARHVNERAEHLRRLRQDIGRALDVLAHDQAKALARLERFANERRHHSHRVGELAEAIRTKWLTVSALPVAQQQPSDAALSRMKELGELAAQLQGERARFHEAEKKAVPEEQECADLAFQITELKERLAAVDDDEEQSVLPAQDRVAKFEAELQTNLDAIAAEVAPLLARFQQFDELRPYLTVPQEIARMP